ncbi:hypothetical protein OG393_30815 [Streptomyces sp. NBC_01216]|uniref:hypothetical protein n=1 Tax=Streptomyces sp. NBC_01216 TaxID=2903778 RepID=UPI002E12EB2C|nr:hypothetical protein OG393_30815 [Streptomyces sp. NBC_01216]
MSEREHGTYAKYKLDHCRCYPCCAAVSRYGRNRRQAIAYGRWQPYVDAEAVRQHVRALGEFGIGWKRAAHLAGLSVSVVGKLLYGARRGMAPSKVVRSRTAMLLLAVEPTLDNLGSVVPVDATGTRRRLQALVAAGWPQARLATRLGMGPSNFARTFQRDQVTVRTVRLTRSVYEELWNADPRAHGVDNQAYARAKNHAAANGWAPAGAWDDDRIDDPAAFPDWTGMCGTPEGHREHRRVGIRSCQPCRDAVAAERRTSRAAS